ncbi:unnamed protein product [Tetraodon nigroviridis]|uniref:(spotted green pufferfish) hypothetical protein n=1 Tax=Tetraodon nigroviridis TaxID=99883 RepID=Q4RIK4_TETNG|nr:unnamed protein product [Tetraodon nigroviridis]
MTGKVEIPDLSSLHEGFTMKQQGCTPQMSSWYCAVSPPSWVIGETDWESLQVVAWECLGLGALFNGHLIMLEEETQGRKMDFQNNIPSGAEE